MMDNLVARGHPRKNVLEKFGEVFTPNQEPQKSEDTIVFTTTFNPAVGYPRKVIYNLSKDSRETP